ncbi:MAG: DUF1080 domain-containing protein [Verrucomicrobiales bacterium]|nr:DUF1080 domain-containing protein [Verrucomicrobiales bacterium]
MKMKIFPVMAVLVLFSLINLCAEGEKPTTSSKKETKKQSVSLFDGKTLKGWKLCNYAGLGEVKVSPETGALRVTRGEILSGIRIDNFDKRKLPKVNYELSLEARRVEGEDFFCCLTFPYKKTHASFVLGGWGGSVCGISSIDFMDAMENSTMTVRDFDQGKWYKLRLLVTENRFQGFVEEKKIVNVGIKGRKIGMRFGEIEESVPLGLSTFRTTAEYKNISIRHLEDEEIAAAKKLDEEDEF